MNRYKNKDGVKVGDRIMLDNKSGFLKDLPRVKFVGDVVDKELDGDLILVSFLVNGHNDRFLRDIPYFLAQ